MFPTAMLARLYTKGSLKNTPAGFEFAVRNIIDGGTLVGMGPLGVDDATIQPAAVTLTVGEKTLPASEISSTRPLAINAYATVRVSVQAAPLAPGEHKLTIQLLTREIGKLQFSVADTLG